jgi:hypothetical protein
VTSDGRLPAKDGGVGGDAYKQRVFLSGRHRVVLFFPRAQVSDRALESVGCTAAQLIVSFRKWHVSPAGASPEAIHQASMFGSAAGRVSTGMRTLPMVLLTAVTLMAAACR